MKEQIEINPNVHFGKPCVTRPRIPVVSVLELISEGLSFDRIRRGYYPDLNINQIAVCLDYPGNQESAGDRS